MSLTGWLGRRRRARPPEAEHPRARWSTAGELAGAFACAAGVTKVPTTTAGPPIEQICKDLHRINDEIVKVLSDPRIPARYHRLLAASWAYDAALRDACRAVGLEPPEPKRLGEFQRLETEAVLTAHGLNW